MLPMPAAPRHSTLTPHSCVKVAREDHLLTAISMLRLCMYVTLLCLRAHRPDRGGASGARAQQHLQPRQRDHTVHGAAWRGHLRQGRWPLEGASSSTVCLALHGGVDGGVGGSIMCLSCQAASYQQPAALYVARVHYSACCWSGSGKALSQPIVGQPLCHICRR